MKLSLLVLVGLVLSLVVVDPAQAQTRVLSPHLWVQVNGIEGPLLLPRLPRLPVLPVLRPEPTYPRLQPYRRIGPPVLVGADGTYLGVLSNNPYDPQSVSNPYGRYGSPYSPKSVNNSYGRYGSPYSPYSATNPYALAPPRTR